MANKTFDKLMKEGEKFFLENNENNQLKALEELFNRFLEKSRTKQTYEHLKALISGKRCFESKATRIKEF